MRRQVREVTWQNPRVLGLLLLVFLCGAAAGAVAHHLRIVKAATGSTVPNQSPASRESKETLEHLKTELDLTPAQEQQIRVILEDYMKYMQLLKDQMEDTRANGKARIMSVLTDEQKIKFEKQMSEFQKQK